MKKEIMLANYWEIFKYAKDLHKFYPADHPKIIKLNEEMQQITEQLNKL